MKAHDLVQGSHAWLAYRATHFNASDAPAMMGCSPYKTRAQLMRELHTGVPAEVDVGTQMRFNNGHRAEALARPLAEEFVGEELYPCVGSEGRLSASFDGLTLDERIGFEHKALNDELRAAVIDEDSGPRLPLMHRVQMEQQMLVSGAEKVLFMTSSWTAEGELNEERHCWYCPDPALRQSIVDGWAQFERDLAAYVLPESVEPAPAGKAPESLPALRIEVTGEVTASNLAEFKSTALAAIRSVNRELRTDADFADAGKAITWCSDVESRLKAAKEHALSQTASIDALFKTIDDISAEARTVRLELDKLVARRKTEVKEHAVDASRKALDAHIATLNGELAPLRLLPVVADFAAAIKGLRSISSMQDALDTTLANGKIAADAQARQIRGNVATFKEQAEGIEFLFSDLGQLVHKDADDFALSVQHRVSVHRAAEAERERKRKADEEARIAAEAKRLADEQIRQAQEAQRQAAADAAAVAANAQRAEWARLEAEAAERKRLEQQAQAPAAAPTPAPATPAPPREPGSDPLTSVTFGPTPAQEAYRARAAADPATLKLGAICERLGITMTAQFLADVLHVRPARVDGASRLFTEGQYLTICRQLQSHVSAMAELYAGVEA